MFEQLQLDGWRQFAHLDIHFHPRITILTGGNGAGKTTLLHLLNRHWGWSIPYVSEPRLAKDGKKSYWAGFWNLSGVPFPNSTAEQQIRIGQIKYRSSPTALLTVPRAVTETFAVTIKPMPKLPGVYVPSHRPLYIHRRVEEIPTAVDARQQLFDVYVNEIRGRWNVGQRVTSPSQMLKRSLMSLAVFGYGSVAVTPNDDARRTFEGFQEVLSHVLPATIGFKRLRVSVPDVILETETGNFALDAASGGISALIDIAWQIYLYSTLAEEFVVAIDEPEAHLHPALQRAILPSLLDAFPKAQFIIATHNPFVVGSTPDSSVYVLRYDDDRRVCSELMDQVNRAGTANEILRSALGLESTAPIWVEKALERILTQFKCQEMTDESLAHLRSQLSSLGLGKYLPDTLDRLQE